MEHRLVIPAVFGRRIFFKWNVLNPVVQSNLIAAGFASLQSSLSCTITVGVPVNGGATFSAMKHTNSRSFAAASDNFTPTRIVSDGTPSAAAR